MSILYEILSFFAVPTSGGVIGPMGKHWFACIWYNIGIDRWENVRYRTELFPACAGVVLSCIICAFVSDSIPPASGGVPCLVYAGKDSDGYSPRKRGVVLDGSIHG